MNKKEKIRRKKLFNEFEHAEEDFFTIDKENRLAKIDLSFDKVSDVFDVNYVTKTPVLSDDFLDWFASAFKMIPARYKIEFSVSFNDYEGYTKEQLNAVFWKNIMLDAKNKRDAQKKRNSIAYGLIAIGVAFFIGMLITEFRWKADTVAKTIFSYVSDIATTVAFWEAMTILIVERRENRSYLKDVTKRFTGVRFT
ncbi:MAG: hypothetical protein ACI4SH_04985 [Candidatus Scatosoma sp.]